MLSRVLVEVKNGLSYMDLRALEKLSSVANLPTTTGNSESPSWIHYYRA